MNDQIVNIFLTGGKKYKNHPKATSPKNFREVPTFDKDTITIIALGNWEGMYQRGSMDNYNNRLKKVLKRAERDFKLVMVMIDESHTSKVCSKCQVMNMENLTVDDISMHQVLHCKKCFT
ncbi:unnamed protein product [Cunninghamella blakesleeana]